MSIKTDHIYIQLVQVEEAFKNLKGDLVLRPIHHQKEERIEAHIFVAFMAYTLHATLRRRLSDLTRFNPSCSLGKVRYGSDDRCLSPDNR